ncbi:MAG: hypothetical protein NTY36_02710 [Deltaproteobacteria bacterium]|nr:hypothetical protein [Deltaproteobacteria bacterium]
MGQRSLGAATAYVRHNLQFKRRDPVEIDSVIFDLPRGLRRTKIILLAHNLSIRLTAVW